MYFWKVNSLIDDLRHQRVGQKEQFKYLLLWGVVTLALTDPWLWKDHLYQRGDTCASGAPQCRSSLSGPDPQPTTCSIRPS